MCARPPERRLGEDIAAAIAHAQATRVEIGEPEAEDGDSGTGLQPHETVENDGAAAPDQQPEPEESIDLGVLVDHLVESNPEHPSLEELDEEQETSEWGHDSTGSF